MIFLSLLFDLLERDLSLCISIYICSYLFAYNNFLTISSIFSLSSNKNPNKTLFLNSMYAFLSVIFPSKSKYRK